MEVEASIWENVKFGDSTKYNFQGDSLLELYEMTLDLKKSKDKFEDDIINTLDVNPRKRMFVIGTEKGRVLLFSLHKNRVVHWFQSDTWLNSAILFHKTIICSGFNKSILAYSIRTKPCILQIKSDSKLEGFTNKGVIYSKMNHRCFMLANTGFVQFKVLNIHTRRLLRCFKIPESEFSRDDSETKVVSKRVVSNYTLMDSSKTIAFVTINDCNLYFYNLFLHKMMGAIKLRNALELGNKMFLANTILMADEHYLIVIQQFLKNSAKKTKPRTYFYLSQVNKAITGAISPMLLQNCELEGLDIIISSDIFKLRVPFFGAYAGYVMVLGMTSATTKSFVIDLDKHTCLQSSNVKNSRNKGRPDSADEEISATAFYDHASISCTSNGRVIFTDSVEYPPKTSTPSIKSEPQTPARREEHRK